MKNIVNNFQKNCRLLKAAFFIIYYLFFFKFLLQNHSICYLYTLIFV